LTGCANSQLKWNHLKSDVQETLQLRFIACCELIDGKSFSNNLHSLQKMGAKWYDLLTPGLQTEILKSLVKLPASLDPQQRSMCIYSLGSLGVVFSDCDFETQKVIVDVAKRVFNSKITGHVGHSSLFGQQQSNLFIGLALMGFKRSNMDAILIKAINHSLQYNLGFGDPQQVPNTIHS
jgi:hypothetical protein